MQIEGQKICVVGLGRTGRAAVRFAAQRGAEVLVSEAKEREKLDLNDIMPFVADAEFGKNSLDFIGRADLVVISPGVSLDSFLFKELFERKVKVISELELASFFITAPIVAVTGSLGKSTTVALIGEMAKSNGLIAFVGGNFGPPAIEAADKNYDLCVLEVSSFQLEATFTFCPHVSAWLSLVGHHLKRHGGFERYAKTKLAMFANQTERDVAVINGDDPAIIARMASLKAKKFLFSTIAHPMPGIFLEKDNAVRVSEKGREEYPLVDFRLSGRHNVQNLLCAIGCARAAGIKRDAVISGYSQFNGLEHRIEDAGTFKKVRFINDSKATTPIATCAAIESVKPPIILMVGGKDESEDFSPVINAARGKVKTVVTFGESAKRLGEIFNKEFDVLVAENLKSAVDRAKSSAKEGDTVLFSPGCPSFDEFTNFEERGKKFKELVKNAKA